LKSRKHKCEYDQVEDVDEEHVEEPPHHIFAGVEYIEREDHHSHDEEHCKAYEIADCIPPSHVLINDLESLIDLFRANSSHQLPEMHRHSKDKCHRYRDYPYNRY
jgi:hypothetical protein